jgi:hypothetical protein
MPLGKGAMREPKAGFSGHQWRCPADRRNDRGEGRPAPLDRHDRDLRHRRPAGGLQRAALGLSAVAALLLSGVFPAVGVRIAIAAGQTKGPPDPTG